MNIAILGWYGTETIGDRAILAGLFNLFSDSYGNYDIRLGCLDTLLTQRTLEEDYSFFKECSNNKLNDLSLFDSRINKELISSISWADIVCIGGGPLMEIDAMYMLLYAFTIAKKKKKKCIIAGCGMGPFKTPELLNVSLELINIADLVIFRDATSNNIYRSNTCSSRVTHSLIDPAAIACLYFLNDSKKDNNADYVAINFREPPVSEYEGLNRLDSSFFSELLKDVASHFKCEIRLVPMHTYHIGGDDRYFLNRIARESELSSVEVINRPLSLKETMRTYFNANLCIGMRFHSILLQTILNGKNCILDYTDPKNGKIINLLNHLTLKEKYEGRYASLVKAHDYPHFNFANLHKIEIDISQLITYKNNFVELFYNVIKTDQ